MADDPRQASRENDVFEWRYIETDKRASRSGGRDPYWCCSRFGVLRRGVTRRPLVVDTYWSTGDGRVLRLCDEGVVFKYLGNLEDYDKVDPSRGAYFADADVMDLRHPNDRSSFYVRKGAVRDRDKMLAEVERRLEEARTDVREARTDVREAEGRLERAKSLWMELKCGLPLDQIHL